MLWSGGKRAAFAFTSYRLCRSCLRQEQLACLDRFFPLKGYRLPHHTLLYDLQPSLLLLLISYIMGSSFSFSPILCLDQLINYITTSLFLYVFRLDKAYHFFRIFEAISLYQGIAQI